MGSLQIRFFPFVHNLVSAALLRHGVIQQPMERDPNEEDGIEDFRIRAHGVVASSLASHEGPRVNWCIAS